MSFCRKILLIAIIIGCPLTVISSKAAIGTWQAFMAYHDITAIEPAGNTIFVLASKNLYCYSTTDQSITTYSKMGALSDCNIKHIAWSSTAKRLVIVYENGNIDLLSRDGTCNNIADYYNKSLTTDKTVNSVAVVGDNAYLCTAFGVVKLNVSKAEISETYNLGKSIKGLAVVGNNIYISTVTNGIYSASTNENLVNKLIWKRVNQTSAEHFVQLGQQIICANGTEIMQYNTSANTFSNIITLGSAVERMATSGNHLMAGNSSENYCFSSASQYVKVARGGVVSFNESDNLYWCGENNLLASFTIDSNSSISFQTKDINPGGPRYNHFYSAIFKDNILLTAGGFHGAGVAEMQYPGTVQMLKGNDWTIFDDNVLATSKIDFYQDQNSVAIDPSDTSHVFASGKTGLYEFRSGKLVKYYGGGDGMITLGNLGNGNTNRNYVMTQNIMFDSSGNLWILQSLSSKPLVVLKKDGTWEDHSNSLMLYNNVGMANLTGLMTDSRGLIWFVNYHWEPAALFCYNPTTKAMKRYTNFTNQDGSQLENAYPTCVAEDKDNNIWVGTTSGPLLLYASDVTSGSETFTQVKVPRNDGTNYADYLLSGQQISSIAIDGGNRKWFSTNNNGVYLISSDNMTQLYNFTASNSPLLDNNVHAVVLNNSSGETYLLTESGLCSYMSDASESNNEMEKDKVWAYPNPVSPDYTGLITITGLSFNADVKIVSASGQLVASGKSNGGIFTWDGLNQSGNRVASGVYHVLAATSEGKKGVVCRIAIVR